MTPTTRTFCPLCDWHHDSADAEPTMPAPGMSIEEHAKQTLMAHYAGLEVIVREHLESHPLIEWVTEVARLQKELNTAVAKGDGCGTFVVGGALAGLLPTEGPVFCHHPEAVRGVRSIGSGIGRRSLWAVSCPVCPAFAESIEGEPVLNPWLLAPLRTPATGGDQ